MPGSPGARIGNVSGVQLVCSPGGEFDDSTKEFVMGMTFVPAMHEGTPIRGAGIQTIVYTLR